MAVLVDHGRSIGGALSLLGEQIGECLGNIHVDILARPNLDETLGLLVAHDGYAVDVAVGARHHVAHRGFDSMGHHAHGIAAVHRQTRLHADVIVVASKEDVSQHVVEHITAVLLHQWAMIVTKVVSLFPTRQRREVERNARLNAQVAAEVRERIG